MKLFIFLTKKILSTLCVGKFTGSEPNIQSNLIYPSSLELNNDSYTLIYSSHCIFPLTCPRIVLVPSKGKYTIDGNTIKLSNTDYYGIKNNDCSEIILFKDKNQFRLKKQ